MPWQVLNSIPSCRFRRFHMTTKLIRLATLFFIPCCLLSCQSKKSNGVADRSEAAQQIAKAPASHSASLDANSPASVKAEPKAVRPSVIQADSRIITEPRELPWKASEARHLSWVEDSDKKIQSDEKRVFALVRNVWIYGEPSRSSQWVGFLWFGGYAKIKDKTIRAQNGCQHWVALEPRGYVCVDDEKATLNRQHPTLVGLLPYAPQMASSWPHLYGDAREAYRYEQLPSEIRQRSKEWDFHIRRNQLEAHNKDGKELPENWLGVDNTPSAKTLLKLPNYNSSIQMDHDFLKNGSTLAWIDEVRHEDRSFYLSADLRYVPKDRIAPYEDILFHGLHLNEEINFPLAGVRKDNILRYKEVDGSLQALKEPLQRLSWLKLSGEEKTFSEEKYTQLQDGTWVKAAELVIPKLNDECPWGGKRTGPDALPIPRGRGTWLDVSIEEGWLIAYEMNQPVFVTLISPGRGGAAKPGADPLATSATPTGKFRINGKFASATMISPGKVVHSDVPWALNFSGLYAIHGAYWHNNWGNRQSGGCINASPLDAKWLFDFTEPRAPDGWHGTRWIPKQENATHLWVHR